MKSAVNRWGKTIRVGDAVTAHHPRGGSITGKVTKIARMSGYGIRATLDSGHSIGIDDAHSIVRANPGKRPRDNANREVARELMMYAEQTRELYNMRVSIHKALLKKIRAGTYSESKALIAWGRWFDNAAKLYAKEFASPGDWNRIFSKATRKLAARAYASSEAKVLKMAARGETDQYVYNPAKRAGKIAFDPFYTWRGQRLKFTRDLKAAQYPPLGKGWFVHGRESTGNTYGGMHVKTVAWPSTPENKASRVHKRGWRTRAEAQHAARVITRAISMGQYR